MFAFLHLLATTAFAGGPQSAPEVPGARSEPWWVSDAASVESDYIIVTPERFLPEAQALAVAVEALHALLVTPITLAEIREGFPGAIPDSADTASIREALAFAYENWKTAPLFVLLLGDAAEDESQVAYNLLPTPHLFQNEYGGWCDGTYAMDAWYGDVVDPPANPSSPDPGRREIAVGRLPIRTEEQAAAYRAKLDSYVRVHASRSRAGFVVGDLSLLQDNANRRPAAQRLMTYIHSSAGLDTTALYSYDFSALIPPAGDYLPEEVEAGRDRIIDLINDGVGILEFFGNTYPADAVTHTLWYDNHPLVPQFRASMLGNTDCWPFVIFSHCKVGAFDEYAYFGISPIEDFVLTPAVGAIAAMGKGQMTYFEADEPISQRIYETILSDGGGSCVGFQESAALQRYLSGAECSRAEARHTARMVNLIGDPALGLRLGLTPRHLVGTFELRGAVPLQNRFVSRSGWNSGSLDTDASRTRVVHNGDLLGGCGAGPDPAAPIEGQRMLQLHSQHAPGGNLCCGAWTVFARRPYDDEPLVRLAPEGADRTVLSYWIRQDAGPSGRGRVFVDLITEAGRVLSSEGARFYDQYGCPHVADSVDYPLGTWQHICVRLDTWAQDGVGIDSLVIRYVDEGEEETEVCAFLDAVYLGEWCGDVWSLGGALAESTAPEGEEQGNLLLNGAFRWDADSDGAPDFWTGPFPALHEPFAGLLWVEGDPAVILSRTWAQPAAISQILPRSPSGDGLAVRVTLRGWPGDQNDCLAVRLRDLDDGGILVSEDFLNIGADWDEQLLLLDAVPAGHCCLFEIEAVSGSVLVGSVGVARPYGTDAAGTLQAEPERLRLWPTPATDRIAVSWPSEAKEAGPPRACHVRLLGIDGRALGSASLPWHRRGSPQAPLEIPLERLAGRRAAAGHYFLELRSGERIHRARLVIVR